MNDQTRNRNRRGKQHAGNGGMDGGRRGPRGDRGGRGQGRYGKGGGRDAPAKPLNAAYNFVPLSPWVHLPDWGRSVSHDHPWEDGWSGSIDYTLSAHSPLLVGREKEPDNHVRPWRNARGEYAIPGSSIKGMLRAVTEIAAFGRMRFVDDQALSWRDLHNKAYTKALTATDHRNRERVHKPKARAGWLHLDVDGVLEIEPCDFARIPQKELARHAREKLDREQWGTFWDNCPRCNLEQKYGNWRKNLAVECLVEQHAQIHESSADLLRYRLATFSGNDAKGATIRTSGTLVFTGQSMGARGKKAKHREFVFLDNPAPVTRLPVAAQEWRHFLEANVDANGVETEAWKYWRTKRSKPIPVFYLPDAGGGVAALGLALMFRLPFTHSIHDAIGHTSTAHLDPPGLRRGYDLADLLFGAVHGEDERASGRHQEDSLRGRVSCMHAVLDGNAREMDGEQVILNGPKPSFYPSYIHQPGTEASGQLRHKGNYKTLMDADAELRGFKRYPARPKPNPPRHNADQERNRDVCSFLHPLEPGCRFRGRIVFHNLRRVELGALLWVLSWGDNAELRHSLGMGKPFGYGQVSFHVDAARLHPNLPGAAEPTVPELCKDFASYMEEHYAASGAGSGWVHSPQLRALLTMANPAEVQRWQAHAGRPPEHPRLEMGGNNDFTAAKKAARSLAFYADAAPGKPRNG